MDKVKSIGVNCHTMILHDKLHSIRESQEPDTTRQLQPTFSSVRIYFQCTLQLKIIWIIGAEVKKPVRIIVIAKHQGQRQNDNHRKTVKFREGKGGQIGISERCAEDLFHVYENCAFANSTDKTLCG